MLGGGRASGRHRAGARHFGRRGGTAMMIKFLARGTGSAGSSGGLPHPRENSPHTDRTRTRKKSKCCGAIHTKVAAQWPPWPMRFSSSISTRRASSPGHRRTTRAMRKLAVWWPSSRKPPGRLKLSHLARWWQVGLAGAALDPHLDPQRFNAIRLPARWAADKERLKVLRQHPAPSAHYDGVGVCHTI